MGFALCSFSFGCFLLICQQRVIKFATKYTLIRLFVLLFPFCSTLQMFAKRFFSVTHLAFYDQMFSLLVLLIS